MPLELVHRMAQAAGFKGAPTSLQQADGLLLGPGQKCHFARVHFPMEKFHWFDVAMPGGTRHITLEETGAKNWALEDRLYRDEEPGHKCLQVIDNTGTIGSGAKGRSSSPSLNEECWVSTAIEVFGDLIPFYLYCESARNPADRPSRNTKPARSSCAENEDDCDQAQDALACRGTDKEITIPLSPFSDGRTERSCLVLAAGSNDAGVGTWMVRLGAEHGIRVRVHMCDSRGSPEEDLCDDMVFTKYCELVDSGQVHGVLAIPASAWWVAERKVWFGPVRRRQVRERALPFRPLNGLNELDSRRFHRSSLEVLRCLELASRCFKSRNGECALGLVHPSDAGGPHVSLWAAELVVKFEAEHRLERVFVDTCMLNGLRVNPLTISTNVPFAHRLSVRCNHGPTYHRRRTGESASTLGVCGATGAIVDQLAAELARVFVRAFVATLTLQ